jgi:hypothetical protein
MLKEDEHDAENWCRPRVPLRPPFNPLIDPAKEQPQCPSGRTGSCIPDTSKALRQHYGLTPAVAEVPLATVEVNSSDGLAGQRQKDHDSINMSWEVSGRPLALMIGGTGISSGGIEKGSNNIKSYMALPRGQGSFPPRGPQARGSPYIPTLTSGVLMEIPRGNTRMLCKGRLAHVSFPLPGLGHYVDNWQRPMPLSSNVPGLSCSTAHCFIPPQTPNFNPFLTMPIAFASPPVFGPHLSPYFAHYHSGGIRFPASTNKELI